MVSFGHAAYLGIGSYSVGILSYYDISNGFLHFGVAIAAAALTALAIGWVSLRTSGVHFIMITLAFSQMIYFLCESLNQFGGDNGLNIPDHSNFAGLLDLDNAATLYYLAFACLIACLLIGGRLVDSRFGMVVRGAKSNERRMAALGFSTFRYRLTAFVIAGAMGGLAGALLANQTLFLSPSIMHWTRSGEIMMMVILGGMGTLFGPVARRRCLSAAGERAVRPDRALAGGPWPAADPAGAVLQGRRTRLARQQPRVVAMAETLLATRGLLKRFGGLVATNALSLDIAEGEIHAVIGPNGAGKTTLVAQLAGELAPDEGTVPLRRRSTSPTRRRRDARRADWRVRSR